MMQKRFFLFFACVRLVNLEIVLKTSHFALALLPVPGTAPMIGCGSDNDDKIPIRAVVITSARVSVWLTLNAPFTKSVKENI